MTGAAGTFAGALNGALRPSNERASTFLFCLYLLFIAVTLLSIPQRLPAVGAARPTVLFVGIIAVGLFLSLNVTARNLATVQTRWLIALIAYVIVSLPLVEWPGSVLRANLEIFVRAIVFFFFTLALVDTRARLGALLLTFVTCQTLRVLEPLYLHVTEGYWGSSTHVGNWEMMDRLAGAPADTINPNGLAAVILTVIPFLHFWATAKRSLVRLLIYLPLLSALVWALLLTSSRSGMVGFAVVVAGMIWFSRRRVIYAVASVTIAAIVFGTLGAVHQERYLSLVRSDVRSAATVEARVTGIKSDVEVALARPVFGHGLGTSAEALYNRMGGTHRSHNLYTEVFIELGIVGLAIFLGYLRSILITAKDALPRAGYGGGIEAWFPKAILVWFVAQLIFSLAAYGLSDPDWYFIGALVVCAARISLGQGGASQGPNGVAAAPSTSLPISRKFRSAVTTRSRA